MRLQNKTIIITGASSGIGESAAALFAGQGANVVLGARRENLLTAHAAQIRDAGGRAVCLAGDVVDEAYAKALVELAVSEFGGLDGAFNNAGTLGELGPVPDMPADLAGGAWVVAFIALAAMTSLGPLALRLLDRPDND